MSTNKDDLGLHPLGEAEQDFASYLPPQKLDTLGGVIKVRWEENAGVSMHGAWVFFIEFLKVSFSPSPSHLSADFVPGPKSGGHGSH